MHDFQLQGWAPSGEVLPPDPPLPCPAPWDPPSSSSALGEGVCVCDGHTPLETSAANNLRDRPHRQQGRVLNTGGAFRTRGPPSGLGPLSHHSPGGPWGLSPPVGGRASRCIRVLALGRAQAWVGGRELHHLDMFMWKRFQLLSGGLFPHR